MMPTRATTNPARLNIMRLIAGCAALNLTLLALLLVSKARLNSDFMAFWAYPRFAAGAHPEWIYNAASLKAFEQTLYPGFHSFYPYIYPPPMLLALSWLKTLPFGAAELVWTALGVIALALGTRALFPARPWAALAGLLASPAALLCIATGQTGLFATALLLAGFAYLPKRPALAGVWFGLLTLKPQFGLLVAVFLLARGARRCILTASLTTLMLAGAACLFLPATLWPLWLHAIPAYQNGYFQASHLNIAPVITPAANLAMLGAGPATIWAVQGLCGLTMIALTVWAARCVPYRLAVGIALIASFLAQPHAYAYDSLPIIAALALGLEAVPGKAMQALGSVTYLAPLLLLSAFSPWFFYSPLLAACLLALIALAFSARKGAESAHEPDPVLPPSTA